MIASRTVGTTDITWSVIVFTLSKEVRPIPSKRLLNEYFELTNRFLIADS